MLLFSRRVLALSALSTQTTPSPKREAARQLQRRVRRRRARAKALLFLCAVQFLRANETYQLTLNRERLLTFPETAPHLKQVRLPLTSRFLSFAAASSSRQRVRLFSCRASLRRFLVARHAQRRSLGRSFIFAASLLYSRRGGCRGVQRRYFEGFIHDDKCGTRASRLSPLGGILRVAKFLGATPGRPAATGKSLHSYPNANSNANSNDKW